MDSVRLRLTVWLKYGSYDIPRHGKQESGTCWSDCKLETKERNSDFLDRHVQTDSW